MSLLPVGFGSQGGGYTIENSLRFRSSASAYLSRTFASTGNLTTWTWSGWVKRGQLSIGTAKYQVIFGCTISEGNNYTIVQLGNNDNIVINHQYGGATVWWKQTSRLFRDPSAWFHLVISVDTNNATAEDRVKFYVNGTRETQFSGGTNPSLGASSYINGTDAPHVIGRYGSSNYFDGYITEVNFIDGQALDASSFGEYNEDTGVWQPKRYAGSYGTNGFYLDFSDNTSTTTLGYDYSGNGNNWTPNSISLTSGVTYDSMTDTPTPYANGGNYAVLNPLGVDTPSGATLNGNLTLSNSASNQKRATIPVVSTDTNKYYWEVTVNGTATSNFPIPGMYVVGAGTYWPGYDGNSIGLYQGGSLVYNGSTVATLTSFANGDVISIAFDPSTGKIWFAKNGTWMASGDPATGTSPNYTLPTGVDRVAGGYTGSGYGTLEFNFGQRPFAYTPPSGFKPLHTGNLPDSVIPSGDDYFKTYTYTGNGGGLQVGEVQKPFSTYNISKSLRFRSSASAYLNRTFTTPTDGKRWTWSGWVKRGSLGITAQLFSAGSALAFFRFSATDTLLSGWTGASNLETTQRFRDPSAWYHVMLVVDTTQATASNRVKYYVNGVQITAFATTDYPSQSSTTVINSAVVHNIGAYTSSTQFFDGYMAEVNFIDGQALTPSSFGDWDGNDYWVPKAYAGTYGTNGFYLPFTDTTSTTTLVADSSGNGNDWTPNNISLTSGVTYDSMTDVPTLTSATAANYPVLSPIDNTGVTISNANLTATTPGSNTACKATMAFPTTGKFYFEVTDVVTGGGNIAGIANVTLPTNTSLYAGTGSIYVGMSSNAVFGLAFNFDALTYTIYKNNSVDSTGSITSGITYITFMQTSASGGASTAFNFGQRPFAYTPPTGFLPLHTGNVPEDTTDLETPDLVWIKSRNASQSHTLFDSVRGTGIYLSSNTTTKETDDVNSLLQFNKNGFLLGSSSAVNTSGNTYAAWGWKESVSAGFDIVTFTSTVAPQTVSHNLGVAPSMIILKNTAVADAWFVYHKSLGETKGIYLHLPNGSSTVTWWNNTAPTSSVFSVNMGNAYSQVAYCFADVEGYSKFGSYTGNGLPNGTFVYTGFRPAFVLVKNADVANSWRLWDNARPGYNLTNLYLSPDTPGGEGAINIDVDLISNGFKIRNTNSSINGSGNNIIYAAFAENPFKNSLAR